MKKKDHAAPWRQWTAKKAEKAEKAKKAKLRKMPAKKKNYSDMTADEYQYIIDKLDLTQIQAAKFLDVEPRTSRRWAGGEPIPGLSPACCAIC